MRSLVASLLLPCSLLFLLVLAACGGDGASARRCEQPEGPGWCFCYDDPDRVPADEVATCDVDSVDLGITTSLCCEDGDGQGCECNAYGCYQEGIDYCACGQAVIHGRTDTVEVSSCFAAQLEDHCCLDETFHECTCSILSCNSNEREVSACGTYDVATCGSTTTAVDSCK